MNKDIIQIQIAWFFSTAYAGDFESFSLKLKKKLGESRTTQQLPIDNNMPNEIPRLILSYPDFNLNISKSRIDLFLHDIKSLKSIISNINDVVLSDLSISVGRIGFVKTFFAEEPTEYLTKLLKKENIEVLNLKEVNIRINEMKEIGGYNCNNIESLSTGSMIKKNADGSNSQTNGVIIIRDLNILAEASDEVHFTKTSIDEVIDAFDKESEKFVLAN